MRVLAAIALIVAALAAHFYAMHTGIYAAELKQGVVWFDNVLHALVGVACALLWLSIWKKINATAGKSSTVITMLLFVLLVAVGWELFEYGFYLVFKSGALGLTVYEPSFRESVFDSLSNILGAALLAAVWLSLRATARPSIAAE